ncbi:hypothetical protein HNR34_000645 [Geobacillus subterraneus]
MKGGILGGFFVFFCLSETYWHIAGGYLLVF